MRGCLTPRPVKPARLPMRLHSKPDTSRPAEHALAAAQRLIWDRLRQFVEPAGATALAALTSGAYVPAPGERVAVLLCGANPAPGPFG